MSAAQADRELVRVDDLLQGATVRTQLFIQAGMTSSLMPYTLALCLDYWGTTRPKPHNK